MKHFTPDEVHASETTLRIIRQIAYTYRVAKCANPQAGTCYAS